MTVRPWMLPAAVFGTILPGIPSRLRQLKTVGALAASLSVLALGVAAGQAHDIGGINFSLLSTHAAPIYYQPEAGEIMAKSFADFYDAAVAEVSSHFPRADLKRVPVYIFLDDIWMRQGLTSIFEMPESQASHSLYGPAMYAIAMRRSSDGAVQINQGILVDASFYRGAEEAQQYLTLVHELTHAAVQSYMPSVDMVPRWLNEGMATYLELTLGARKFPVEAGVTLAAYRRALLDAHNNVSGARIYSFEEVSASTDWDRIQLFPFARKVLYAQSFVAVSMMVERAGWPAVLSLLSLMEERLLPSNAIAGATGWSLGAIEEELRAGAAAEPGRMSPAAASR